MGEVDARYNVVFEYTEKAGGYAGVKFWTSYPSKEEFHNEHLPEIEAKGLMKVVAEGVTREEAMEEHSKTPLDAHIRACIDEAMLKSAPRIGGKPQLSKFVLDMQLQTIGINLDPHGWKKLESQFHLVE